MGYLILITGGARSGKSSYALQRAAAIPGARGYIATCPDPLQFGDAELEERIIRHRQERLAGGWQTIEETVDLTGQLHGHPDLLVVLVDCLTLWVNNLLLGHPGLGEEEMADRCRSVLDAARRRRGTVLLVTNEVGLGIVPENQTARRYRDLVGRCNQVMAAGADEVVLTVSGIPITIKKDIRDDSA